MIADEVQRAFDVRLKEAGADARMRLHDRLYRAAFGSVIAQADRAGKTTEVERARFLLRRLYPDLEGPRLDAIIDRLEAEWLAGTWTGVRRSDETSPDSSDLASA